MTHRENSPALLDQETLHVVLAAVCARTGLDPTGARLIKFTNNAVIELAREPVVVRIAGSRAVRKRVSKVVTVARWLAQHDMPAVRLYPHIEQPIQVDGHLATLWHRVPTTGPAPTGADLGRLLLRYHRLPPPQTPLPAWRPLQPIRQRITDTDILTSGDTAFLQTTCDDLELAIAQLTFELPPGPIHGDAFLGNLIPGPTEPIICDFDAAAYGPREWDLTPIAVGRARFAYPGHAQEELAATYGIDITRWPGFPVFRRLRELQLVTSVLPVLRSNPTLTQQWQHRLNTFRDGDAQAVWTPYR